MDNILNQRLRHFLKVARIGIPEAAATIGCTYNSLKRYLDKAKIPVDAIKTLNQVYNLNYEWFFNGTGELFTKKTIPEKKFSGVQEKFDNKFENTDGLNHVKNDWSIAHGATLLPLLNSGSTNFVWFPGQHKGEWAFHVTDDSSEPVVYSGDYISCRPITSEMSQENQLYVVSSEIGQNIRAITQSGNMYKLTSPNKRYAPLIVQNVYQVFEITGHYGPFRKAIIQEA